MRTPPKLADPVIRRQDHVARRTEEPAPARRDPLVFPSGEPRHLAAGLGAKPHPATAGGTGQGLRCTALLRPLGHPPLSPRADADVVSGLTPASPYLTVYSVAWRGTPNASAPGVCSVADGD